ncbi:MAG: CoA transferase [Chloroflexi bacterium]|nr:CoA transferase [Chloroflexota bacterium]
MLPLSGIKVIDMAQMYLGPGAAVYLADQGAEVVKVEPLQGDTMRALASTPYLGMHGFSKSFLAVNRNKRSIAVDVRDREGQEIVHRLAKWADVLILNFRPGAEGRVRMDYDTLAALNPRLIYASVSAFGREGPEAALPGYDIVIQARSGILSVRRDSSGAPVPSAIMMTDMSGCMDLAYAIMVALWDRERTGQGQRVDVSLLQVGLALQMQQLVWTENDTSPLSGQRPNALYSSCYRCADEQWISVVVLENRQWKGLCHVLELEHLQDHPEFASNVLREQMAQELYEILEALFRTRPLAEWLEQLKREGVPCSAVAERNDLPSDPQIAANGMFWEDDHPVAGRTKMVSPPFDLSNSRREHRLRRPTPTLGEHTSEVLSELGYDGVAISNLYEGHIVK